MSRQTPICAVAGTAETAKAIRETPIIIAQSLVFRIRNQLHSDRSRLFCTINNIKYALHVKPLHVFDLILVAKMISQCRTTLGSLPLSQKSTLDLVARHPPVSTGDLKGLDNPA